MTPVEQQISLTSSNPILSRPQFGRRGGQKTAARDPRAGIAVVRDRIRAGNDWERAHAEEAAPLPVLVGDLMTMDGVLPRAAAALAVTALTAVLSWTLLPLAALGTAASYGVAAGAGLPAAALVVIQRRRNPPSAAPALMFAALQGVFLGVFSTTASSHLSPGVFVQTVLGTMAASAALLLARALHWMRMNRRFYGVAGAALLGLGFLGLADWILFPLMGADGLGLRPLGLGIVMGVVGVALGVSFLPLHFRQVENGITYGASRDQSWPAAFGLTLTLVWLYVETVRLLTLFPGEELY
ncbi:membrane protein [Streptomyces olivaceoviridis]|uniref:Bax inhibitor-1/YccA family membrane protein n=1 Tax=Streptomyces olivaceoviridis TaxID=1921 RepID=UPI001677B151|nr:Bax inhibitor-1/YccA family protein [Streptomyces olivaceoviridis]GGZ27711.1 membrane protein [Streptomyces olivaceoviridis]